jgi:hypothetical protein
VEYMDNDAFNTIMGLAKQGFPICLKRTPKEPGKIKSGTYRQRLTELAALKNVSVDFKKIAVKTPLLEGDDLPDFWCKKVNDDYYIFFSHPLSQNLHYPISYGQSFIDKEIKKLIKINVNGKSIPLELNFQPSQSLLVKINKNNQADFVDITYKPPVPVVKRSKEKRQ